MPIVFDLTLPECAVVVLQTPNHKYVQNDESEDNDDSIVHITCEFQFIRRMQSNCRVSKIQLTFVEAWFQAVYGKDLMNPSRAVMFGDRSGFTEKNAPFIYNP